MPQPEPASLTAHLGYWMRYVSNHVSHAFAQRLAAQDVTVAEWAVIRELFGLDAISPSQMADRLGMTRGAISKLADRLADKALILRQENPKDGRAHTLALSSAGRRLVPRLAELADENDAEFFGDLTADDRETMDRVLRGIVERRNLKSIPVS